MFSLFIGQAVKRIALYLVAVAALAVIHPVMGAPLPLYTGRKTTPAPPVGVGLEPVSGIGAWCPFKNIMRCTEPFTLVTTSGAGIAQSQWSMQSSGYPASLQSNWIAKTVVNSGIDGTYDRGSYVLLFSGSGTVSVGGDANPPASVSSSSSSGGRLVFDVPSPSRAGIIITINVTSSTSPVSDMRIGLVTDESAITSSASTAGDDVWNSEWLNALRRFDTIYMPHWQREWYNTYDTRVPTWSSRPVLQSDSTQAGQYGASHEAIAALAVAAKANLWISVPWNADQSYIQSLAAFYAASSAYADNSSRKLYITHSAYVGYISDPKTRIATHKVIYAAFASAFGQQRLAAQVRLLLECQICDTYVPYINPSDPSYDATFGKAIYAIAIPAQTQSGDGGPYTSIQPKPYYYKLRPYLDDVTRIAREQMWYDEEQTYKQIARFAFLGYPTFSYASGVVNTVPMYNMRYLYPGSALADIERQLETNLFNLELTNAAVLSDLWAEYTERWYRSGGSLFVAGKLISYGVRCNDSNTFISAFNRLQCGYLGLGRTMSGLASSRKWQGLQAWMNGSTEYVASLMVNLGAPAAPVCTPACVWGDCVGAPSSSSSSSATGTCECHRGYKGSDCSTFDASTLPNRCSPSDYGMNMPGMPDWEPSWGWTDMSGYARYWMYQRVTQDYPSVGWTYPATTPMPKLRSDGYPAALAPNDALTTALRRDTYHYPAGRYHLFYDGDGIITVSMDTVIDRRVRQGYRILEVKPNKQLNNGIMYSIVRTNPDDPIRNVRVVHDSMLNRFQGQPFHPLFMKMLEEYKFLRFMNVMLREDNVTATSTLNFTQRPTPAFYSQTVLGMAVEHIIRLSNALHIKPWINIPFDATDDYVAGVAQLFKNGLNPKLFPVTVEYSNELWATHHTVGFYGADKAIAAGLSTGSDSTQARSCWAQRRSRQIWQLFAAQGVSVYRVLGGFTLTTDVALKALRCESGVASEVDAVGIAPYLGASLSSATALLSVDEAFAAAYTAINQTAVAVSNHVSALKAFGNIAVVTYEAGPSFFGGAIASSPELTALGNKIHGDARMTALVRAYFAALRSAGSTTMNTYFQGPAGTWSQYGAWGIRQFMDEDPSTQYKVAGYRAYANDFGTCNVNDAAAFASSGCPNGCSGHGYCMADGTCQCYWTYNGSDCSSTYLLPDTQYCNSYTCAQKGGYCASVGVSDGFGVYYCKNCTSGWIGWDCMTPSCATLNNCSWGGSCTAPSTCTCYRGRMGADCSIDCNCNGHGTCNSDGSCAPDSGYQVSGGKTVPVCGASNCLAPGIASCASTTCVYGSCWNGVCSCWAGYTGTQCTEKSTTAAPNANSVLGINVAGISDWSASTEFVNYMWRSRAWFLRQANLLSPSTQWSVPEAVTLTEEGYPAFLPPDRVASTFAMRDANPIAIPATTFYVLYDGDGDLEFGFDAQEVKGTRAKGYVVVRYTPTTVLDNGFFITIRRTNPQNPLRNIRILPEKYPHDAYWQLRPFTDEYLADLAPYRTLRFMDWVNLGLPVDETSYGQYGRTWANRKRLYSASMTTGVGANEDLMIQLCNLVGADPWFSIPHDASDDYVQSFAQLIKRRLRPDVAVHIEHSNEVWNNLFTSHKYAVYRGRQLYGATMDAHEAAMRWHGKRSQEIFTIFRSVFGPLQYNRLKFQLGTFVLSPWHTTIAGGMITVRPVTVAITTYFCDETTMGGDAAAQTMTTAQLVAICGNKVGESTAMIRAQRRAAVALGFESTLSAYEGGVSLVQQTVLSGGFARPGTAATYAAVHTDPAMATIVQSYLSNFTGEGVGLMNWFTSAAATSIYGSWGIKDSTRQTCGAAPKCAGVQQWMPLHANTTLRRVTWSTSQYGTASNAVMVTFDNVPALNQLDAAARNLEVALSVPVFTISAVVDDGTASGRRATGGSTVYFIVAVGMTGVSSATTSSLTATLAATISSNGGSALDITGADVTSSSQVALSSDLAPTATLPAALVPPPPLGGYASPPSPFGATVETPTPSPTTPSPLMSSTSAASTTSTTAAAQAAPSSTPTQPTPTGTPTQLTPSGTPTQPTPTGTPTQLTPTGTPTQLTPTGTPTQAAPSSTATQATPSGTPTQPTPSGTPTQAAPSSTATQPTPVTTTPSGWAPSTAVSPASKAVLLAAMLTIKGDYFSPLLSNLTLQRKLRTAVQSDVAAMLRVSASRVSIDGMALGSLLVNYSVAVNDTDPAAVPEDATAKAALLQRLQASAGSAFAASASLPMTAALYQSAAVPAGVTAPPLVVAGSSVVYVSSQYAAPNPPSDGADAIPGVVAGVVVGVVLVAAAAGGVAVYRLRKTSTPPTDVERTMLTTPEGRLLMTPAEGIDYRFDADDDCLLGTIPGEGSVSKPPGARTRDAAESL